MFGWLFGSCIGMMVDCNVCCPCCPYECIVMAEPCIFMTANCIVCCVVNMGNLNLKLWIAARDGDIDRVVAAISAGADKNWKFVSDNDI